MKTRTELRQCAETIVELLEREVITDTRDLMQIKTLLNVIILYKKN